MRRGLIASCLCIATLALALPAALLWAGPACADSWPMPETTTYFSASKGCRLTVVPRDLDSQIDYFERAAEAGENGLPPEGGPQATLDRRLPDGRWQRVWSRALVNDVTPTDALVSDDMAYVVTLDNWFSTGYGDDVIAIYNVANGGVRALSLEKLLGADYFAALPRSVSSIDWRGGARIEGNQLVIDITVPEETDGIASRHHVPLAIDLASGKPVERSPAKWKEARASAERINAAARAAEQAWRAMHIAPLLGPKPGDERGWTAYLQEAFSRLDSDWIEGYPATDELLARTAPGYRESIKWVTEGIREENGDVRMFAGDDSADLIDVLEKSLAGLRPGALRDVRLYVAAPEAARSRLAAIFAPNGAKLILLDPSRPIPQRPELLPRPDGSLPMPYDYRREE